MHYATRSMTGREVSQLICRGLEQEITRLSSAAEQHRQQELERNALETCGRLTAYLAAELHVPEERAAGLVRKLQDSPAMEALMSADALMAGTAEEAPAVVRHFMEVWQRAEEWFRALAADPDMELIRDNLALFDESALSARLCGDKPSPVAQTTIQVLSAEAWAILACEPTAELGGALRSLHQSLAQLRACGKGSEQVAVQAIKAAGTSGSFTADAAAIAANVDAKAQQCSALGSLEAATLLFSLDYQNLFEQNFARAAAAVAGLPKRAADLTALRQLVSHLEPGAALDLLAAVSENHAALEVYVSAVPKPAPVKYAALVLHRWGAGLPGDESGESAGERLTACARSPRYHKMLGWLLGDGSEMLFDERHAPAREALCNPYRIAAPSLAAALMYSEAVEAGEVALARAVIELARYDLGVAAMNEVLVRVRKFPPQRLDAIFVPGASAATVLAALAPAQSGASAPTAAAVKLPRPSRRQLLLDAMQQDGHDLELVTGALDTLETEIANRVIGWWEDAPDAARAGTSLVELCRDIRQWGRQSAFIGVLGHPLLFERYCRALDDVQHPETHQALARLFCGEAPTFAAVQRILSSGGELQAHS